MRKQK